MVRIPAAAPAIGPAANGSRRFLRLDAARIVIKRALALAAVFLAACASTPLASPDRDADAKRFETAPDAAIIYLYRIDTGDGVSTVWVDGRLIGDTLPETYFRIAVRPGRNRVTASAGDAGNIAIETRMGEVYFIAMRVQGEAHSEAQTNFQSAAPETGKAAILRCCKLLEAWRPGQSRFNF